MRYLITGASGQIGSYAAERLVAQRHAVYGMLRGQKASPPDTYVEGVRYLRGDLLDTWSLREVIREADPDVIFNFGALTAIGMSWGSPQLMAEVTGLGVLRLLEAVRGWNRDIRVVQASSADQFGDYTKQRGYNNLRANEETPFAPQSPYGVAKQFAHDTCLTYRKAYGMHVSTAIQFNCTSPRHGDEFVVRKVTKAAAAIARGVQKRLNLGDLSAIRDWSFAGDVARAYPLIANAQEPGDYVLASGHGHSLEELVATAFDAHRLDWTQHVVRDPNFTRPTDIPISVGDASKAKHLLGWQTEMDFLDIVYTMVQSDLEELERQR